MTDRDRPIKAERLPYGLLVHGEKEFRSLPMRSFLLLRKGTPVMTSISGVLSCAFTMALSAASAAIWVIREAG
jgi:hypothetical protein